MAGESAGQRDATPAVTVERELPPAGGVGFVGRERELGELRGEIGRPGLRVAGGREAERGRVLLVVGRPGIGRTAVALELARQVAADYPGGSFFVRLTGEGGEPLTADQLAEALAPAAGRPALLVLDDVVRGDQLAGVLPSAAGSLVVATSGGPLSGVPDVRPCTLGGLDTPAAVELVARTIGGTRVTNDPRGAETLVQELGGHPTALRLVAAWLAVQPRLSLSETAARLAAVKEPGELVRAFRLVYGSLPATAARILRLLVLAPAGRIDAQVASALAGCSVPAAQNTLDDFVAGALLEGGGSRPYRVPGCLAPLLHALVERLDKPEDVRLARARMLERTVRLLRSCGATLAGEALDDGLPRTLRFASREDAAGWLTGRLPALMAAARAAVADGELDTLARRLVAALVRALVAMPGGPPSMAAERYELHVLVLGVAERRGLHREKAAALINLADLDAEAGREDAALAKYRQALDAARAGDDTDAEGRILEALGGTYLARQDLPRACDWFGRALALRQGRGELVHQARLHARIGSVLTYQGRYGPALREWRSSAGVYKRLGDIPSQARALTEAARVQEYAGHPEDALRTCRDALYWARQAGERRLEAAVLLRLADALDRLGDSSGAGLQRSAAQRLFRPGEFPAF
ncbi:tetratricopeptide repeat protein [Actinacidiphila acidipaludis]|uniref:Tetratricopeptide repeat protein n=1 Tax=Actinacidiphila acidipaludis TaxID=2873382 RepID=A0ABS7Q5Z8_9ACTN|nr:tetratricopeptide repeat protein [Streptomyces acidipaludis]MBY8878532.1 tetratricopeptide repeat protein [Streptomyces acidipaludis]